MSYYKVLGLEKERVWLRWISASEGQKFADTMKEMTEAVKKLGPNPWKREPYAKTETGDRAGVDVLRM